MKTLFQIDLHNTDQNDTIDSPIANLSLSFLRVTQLEFVNVINIQ